MSESTACPGPVIGPNTDGEPCDWCQLCGESPADHTPATPDAGDASGPVKVGKIGLNWMAECDEHAEIIWCSDWAMALEAAYGHVAMYHPRICDHEIGFIISDRHRCLGCGIDLPPLTLSNLDTSPSQEDAS